MDITPNKYITVAYELYTDFDGEREMVEKAPAEHPFQFISDMGTTLEAFEAHIKPLQKGEKFDFTLSVEEAYGEYEQERVLELNKDVFKINGHFDKEHIYPGSVVPLMNADGARFNGTIAEVKEDTVVVDLNHPLAGKTLNFVGEVTENRDATKDEIQGMLNMLSGEGGCGCGCGSCGGCCDDDCDCDGSHHEHGCGHCH
ncbi:MAG: FKBP-type peptidyl-prolyl cis-trans isomerase [Paraprevotella sp.]|jgi:FKBP-type peptidyl-prolyl cis-trans isomerase SlyD|nr:FKBP-type peptidyl-prolyl cis-trans isomerase [Paraprevotella sp.]